MKIKNYYFHIIEELRNLQLMNFDLSFIENFLFIKI